MNHYGFSPQSSPDGAALRVAPKRPPASRVHARGAHDADLNRIP